MNNTIKIGLSGLTAASTRLQVSASNIANINSTSSTGFADDLDNLTSKDAYRPKSVRQEPLKYGGVKAHVVDTPIGTEVSLAHEIVQLKVAEHTYKANAAVIKTAFEVEKTLLDTFSKNKS